MRMFEVGSMTRIALLALGLFAVSGHYAASHARQPIHHIGLLKAGDSRSGDLLRALSDLGYVQGKNISVEARNADGNPEVLSKLAAELVKLRVALIVANGPSAVAAVLNVTNSLPIVMVAGGEPVSRGFAKSLTVPGGNVTGLASSAVGAGGKRLELLKEIFPAMRRVAILKPTSRRRIAEDYLRVAREIKVELQIVDVAGAIDMDRALERIASIAPAAFITIRELSTILGARKITAFGLKNKLPSIYEAEEFVKVGGLISYGINYRAQWPRAAIFVTKILEGANPAFLPIEPPSFELSVNLATARKLDVKIPPEILLEASEIVK
jgi:putative tryptophan/tyrosine transport system substrate-binding protein